MLLGLYPGESTMNKLKINDKIVSKANPEWGTWRITKEPTEEDNWYEAWSPVDCRIIYTDELDLWNIN